MLLRMLSAATDKVKKTRYTLRAYWMVFLCLFDALATDVGIRMHLISEANPFARMLYESHVTIFYSYKVGLPLILLTLIPFLKTRALINSMVLVAMLMYACLALYHMVWIVMAVTN